MPAIQVIKSAGTVVSPFRRALNFIGPTISDSSSGDHTTLDFSAMALTSPTITAPVIAGGLTASGSASNDFSASTGTFKTSTGAGTLSGTTTLAANKNLLCAAGTSALDFSLGTGDCSLPTGAVGWAGASGKAMSLVATAAAMTLTAAATSVWKTTVGNLTLDAAAVLNIGPTLATSVAVGRSGQSIGFYGVTPATRPTAFTQTFATSGATHSNPTAVANTVGTLGGSANTVMETIGATNAGDVSGAIMNNFQELFVQGNALVVDLANVKGVLNKVIDDLQSLGLLQ